MSTINALFVGHGSPMNAVEENNFTQGWRDLGQEILSQRTPAPSWQCPLTGTPAVLR